MSVNGIDAGGFVPAYEPPPPPPPPPPPEPEPAPPAEAAPQVAADNYGGGVAWGAEGELEFEPLDDGAEYVTYGATEATATVPAAEPVSYREDHRGEQPVVAQPVIETREDHRGETPQATPAQIQAQTEAPVAYREDHRGEVPEGPPPDPNAPVTVQGTIKVPVEKQEEAKDEQGNVLKDKEGKPVMRPVTVMEDKQVSVSIPRNIGEVSREQFVDWQLQQETGLSDADKEQKKAIYGSIYDQADKNKTGKIDREELEGVVTGLFKEVQVDAQIDFMAAQAVATGDKIEAGDQKAKEGNVVARGFNNFVNVFNHNQDQMDQAAKNAMNVYKTDLPRDFELYHRMVMEAGDDPTKVQAANDFLKGAMAKAETAGKDFDQKVAKYQGDNKFWSGIAADITAGAMVLGGIALTCATLGVGSPLGAGLIMGGVMVGGAAIAGGAATVGTHALLDNQYDIRTEGLNNFVTGGAMGVVTAVTFGAGSVATTAGRQAATGGAIGAGTSFAGAVTSEGNSWEDVIVQTAIGGATGAALGVVTPSAGGISNTVAREGANVAIGAASGAAGSAGGALLGETYEEIAHGTGFEGDWQSRVAQQAVGGAVSGAAGAIQPPGGHGGEGPTAGAPHEPASLPHEPVTLPHEPVGATRPTEPVGARPESPGAASPGAGPTPEPVGAAASPVAGASNSPVAGASGSPALAPHKAEIDNRIAQARAADPAGTAASPSGYVPDLRDKPVRVPSGSGAEGWAVAGRSVDGGVVVTKEGHGSKIVSPGTLAGENPELLVGVKLPNGGMVTGVDGDRVAYWGDRGVETMPVSQLMADHPDLVAQHVRGAVDNLPAKEIRNGLPVNVDPLQPLRENPNIARLPDLTGQDGRNVINREHTQQRAAEQYAMLSPEDQARVWDLHNKATSQAEQSALQRALATGADLPQMEAFSATLQQVAAGGKGDLKRLGLSDQAIRELQGMTPDQRVLRLTSLEGHQQFFTKSCNPTSFQIVRAEYDPIYALQGNLQPETLLHEQARVLRGANLQPDGTYRDPNGQVLPEVAYLRHDLVPPGPKRSLLDRLLGRNLPGAGYQVGQPNAGQGSIMPAMAEQLNQLSGQTGVTYRAERVEADPVQGPNGAYWEARPESLRRTVDQIDQMLIAGRPTQIGVEWRDQNGIPVGGGHAIAVIDRRIGPNGDVQFLLHDPELYANGGWSTSTQWINANDLAGGRVLGGSYAQYGQYAQLTSVLLGT